MLTQKDYCDYNICVALKELGFPQDYIFSRYAKVDKWVDYTSHKKGDLIISEDRFAFTLESESIAAPLLYEAQKWLREEKKIEVNATYDNIVELHWHWYMKSLTNRNQIISNTNHDSYEQALLAGIKEAVKILKEK